MVVNFRVFKKCSPNGKLTLYLGKRDFVDHVSGVEPIDGVIVVDEDYKYRKVFGQADGVIVVDEDYKYRKVFGQVVCSFRYGREEDEVMGLNFQKDLYLVSEQVFPAPEKQTTTKLQDRLLRKLGANAYPFTFTLPASSPASVMLQPGSDEDGKPCGVHYYIKMFVGESDADRSHKRSTITMAIRKVQYAPTKPGKQPCTVVRKDFMLSPGELELEVTLDKQLYHHGEKIGINICIRNNSNKVVKKIKAMIQQGVDVVLFQNGQYRTAVASTETQEGCPIQPGSSMQKIIYLTPLLSSNKDRRGIAIDGQLKKQDTNLASSTLLANPDSRDAFGIIVSYAVKVKLFLGALGGELSAELPFILMHPKICHVEQPGEERKLIHADSQADVEMFRQDTVDPDNELEPLWKN
ncbi:Arrestin (or S-antigen), N-terminal domain [Popillia japonica]|uniref:Phosrestin-2 n=1 Tax=Popillia japonica TaxID=7064 RepID=A0AAW1JY11_POPJA